MEKRSDNDYILFKAGLFIIFTLSLLIFSILWLRLFSLSPEKIITAKFEECGPISKGVPVYYHGVNIGKVDDVNFSDDFRYTLVKILIYRRKLALPKNIYAEIKTEGLTGQKYVGISYPENPSKETLQNGDVIEGRLSDFYQIAKSVSKAIKNGQLEKTFGQLDNTSTNATAASEKAVQLLTLLQEVINSNRSDIRKLISESALSAANVHISSTSIKNLSTSPEINQDIRTTISNMSKSSQKLDKITTNVQKITVDMDKITGDCNFREDILKTADNAQIFSERLNRGDLNCLITKTLQDTNRTVNRYDCIGASFSDMMGERFLLMRLMFGKPGQSFQKCTDLQCVEEQLYKPCPCPNYSCPNR